MINAFLDEPIFTGNVSRWMGLVHFNRNSSQLVVIQVQGSQLSQLVKHSIWQSLQLVVLQAVQVIKWHLLTSSMNIQIITSKRNDEQTYFDIDKVAKGFVQRLYKIFNGHVWKIYKNTSCIKKLTFTILCANGESGYSRWLPFNLLKQKWLCIPLHLYDKLRKQQVWKSNMQREVDRWSNLPEKYWE